MAMTDKTRIRCVPNDDRGHLDKARVEVISCEPKLPAFAPRDPSEGPFSRGVLYQISSNAKKDPNVKHEAEKGRHPFLNASKWHVVNAEKGRVSVCLSRRAKHLPTCIPDIFERQGSAV